LDAGSPDVMTTVPLVGAQASSVAPPVEPVPPEGAVVLSSAAHVMAEMPAIGAQAGAVAMTPVAADRTTIMYETAAIAPQVVPIVANIARVRSDVATIRADVACVVTHVARRRRSGCLSRDGKSRDCKAKSHCGAQGRES
jgi:hypothetical protein